MQKEEREKNAKKKEKKKGKLASFCFSSKNY
jgi:hypothetical protein